MLYHHIMPLVPGAVDSKAKDKEKEKKDKEKKKLGLKKRPKVAVAVEAGSISESAGFKRKETKHTEGGGVREFRERGAR
jgi:hypothetical protein